MAAVFTRNVLSKQIKSVYFANSFKRLLSNNSLLQDPKQKEISIPVPWGHIAGSLNVLPASEALRVYFLLCCCSSCSCSCSSC
jgi:hypothetical protein